MFGYTEEQALLARVKDRGLVVFTGCGHPTIEVVLGMFGRLSDELLSSLAKAKPPRFQGWLFC
jgi:metal-dependent hydrolase (beta-lactamase superfamily II)